jgi:hypothetical protein
MAGRERSGREAPAERRKTMKGKSILLGVALVVRMVGYAAVTSAHAADGTLFGCYCLLLAAEVVQVGAVLLGWLYSRPCKDRAEQKSEG